MEPDDMRRLQQERSSRGPASTAAGCPSPLEWAEYCSDRLTEAESRRMVLHAGECAACGELLADLMEETQDAVPQELRTLHPEWRKRMAADLDARAAEDSPESPPTRSRRRIVPVGIAAILVAGFVTLTSSAVLSWGVARLATRTFDYRIAGAPYREIVVERGPASTASPAFLGLRLIIAAKDRIGAGGTSWLHLTGRVALYDTTQADHLDRSIDALSTAHMLAADDVTITNDLAVALLLRARSDRGLQQGRDEDVARAIDLLQEALTDRPDPTLYFNLALALEQLPAPNEALTTWDTFLDLEPDGPWSEEAQRRRSELADRIATLTPTQGLDDILFDLPATGFLANARYDLPAIAQELGTRHDDPWLEDFLFRNSSPGSQEATALLQQATAAMRAGLYAQAEGLFRNAADGYQLARNQPGFAFASYQVAYMLQRQSNAVACLAAAQPRLAEAEASGYRWLEIETRGIVALCEGMRREFDRSFDNLVRAHTDARSAGYVSLELRMRGFLSGLFRQLGMYRDALPEDTAVLRRYWVGEGLQGHAYQASYGLADALSGLNYPYAASLVTREAVGLARNDQARALALARYSERLAAVGLYGEAAAALRESNDTFDQLGDPQQRRLERAYASLSEARLLGQQGAIDEGLRKTEAIEASLAQIDNPAIETQYWGVRAEILTRAGRLDESAQALEKLVALGVATQSLSPAAIPKAARAAARQLAERFIEQDDTAAAWRVWTSINGLSSQADTSGGTAWVVFMDAPSGFTALVSRESGTQAIHLRVPADAREAIAGFGTLLAQPDSSLEQLQSTSRTLSALFIEPLLIALDGVDTVFVSTPPALDGIPLTALTLTDGGWLGDELAIVEWEPGRTPDARMALAPDLRLLAVDYTNASTILGTAFPALPTEVTRELAAARDAFPNNTALSGATATHANVARQLGIHEIFQFSGHAVTVADDAALVLSPAGEGAERLLWASQLDALHLSNVRLAVLAACSTSRAPDGSYYPGANMARAFLAAGVPQVLAARWDVDSSATSELMQLFYTELRHGQPPATALRAALMKLREQPRFGHPYYWAGFSLYSV